MIGSVNAILEVPITVYAMNDRQEAERKEELRRSAKSIFRHCPLDQKAMHQLAPAFGSRGGGGGGGFFEGTMGVCSASAWLNSSSSDEDGEADNGEPRGE